MLGAECLVPQRGDKKKLLDMSLRNAQFAMRDRHAQLEQVDPDAAKDRLMETAMHDLGSRSIHVHMECFDNSNIHGTNPASACVVFRNGKPAKRDYRKFNILTVEGPDDFASMKEAVYRRYKRLRDEGESLPQMVVIDGGKGQLSHAMEAIDELGLQGKIAFVGIAKRLEELYFPGDSVPIYLDKRSPTLRVVQQMRDEAHRFSLAHHRKRRSKAFLHSELDDIPGVGPKTRQALMTAFGDVKAISEASEKALLDVVNLEVARAVRVRVGQVKHDSVADPTKHGEQSEQVGGPLTRASPSTSRHPSTHPKSASTKSKSLTVMLPSLFKSPGHEPAHEPSSMTAEGL